MKIYTKAALAAMSAATMLFCSAYAEETYKPTGAWEYSASVNEAGYYDVTALIKNDSVEQHSYLYAESQSATRAQTALPLTVYSNSTMMTADGFTPVTVKGVYVDDGKLDIGLYYPDTKGTVETKSVTVTKSTAYEFLNGGDITEYNYIKSLGGKYFDSEGKEVNAVNYLGENGMNAARVRLSNNPGKGRGDGNYYLPEGFQDEEDCLKLCKLAKESGMQIVFTFNYSDYWSNGERQIIPADWVEQIKTDLGYDVKDPAFLKALTSTQKAEIQTKLAEITYNYTKDYMLRLKEQGTLPEYVSLGNEINGGIFFPFANTFDSNMNSQRFELVWENNVDEANDIKCKEDWKGLTTILNAGYDAVKEVSPESQVIIHIANGSKDSVFTWFFDKYKNAGGKFDVVGASYYPFWSWNKVETAKSFCDTISQRYNKDIMIMETGFNFTPKKKNGGDGQLTSTLDTWIYKGIYEDTQLGHKAYMADVVNAMKQTRCVGILYWDPLMIHVEDPEHKNESLSGWAIRESDDMTDTNVVENTTLFDFDGKVIKTIEVYQDNKNSVKLELGIDTPVFEQNGDNMKVSFTAKNPTKADKAFTALVTSYDDEGRLVSVKQQKVSAKGGADTPVTIDAPMHENTRLFMWDMQNIKPMNEPFKPDFAPDKPQGEAKGKEIEKK